MAAKKILVVEDEPILGLELKEDLIAMGYDVPEVVPDGDKVLPAVIRHKPDLIVLDIKLYGFRDGIEAAGQVRGFYQTPIIFLSSYPESEVKNRVTKTAPIAYLQKPYTSESLMSAIAEALKTE